MKLKKIKPGNPYLALLPVIVCFVFATDAYAQKYYFENYTTTDGLIQGTVRTIYQDTKGRIWFGTAEGVSIYDGTEFYNYGYETGLSTPVFTSFYELVPGVILAATLGNGVVVFVDPPFSKPVLALKIFDNEFMTGRYISQIIPDREGNIWFGTENGITVWKMKGRELLKVENIDTFGNFGKPSIMAVQPNDINSFLIATESGLIRKNERGYELVKYKGEAINRPVFRLFKDSRDRIWFTTENETYFIQNNIVTNLKDLFPAVDVPVYCIAESRKKILYLGSINGIFQIDNSQLKFISKENGLDKKDIIYLMCDREDNLWLGSLSGVSKLPESGFNFVNTEDFEGHLSSIIEREGRLYATSSSGLYEITDKRLLKTNIDAGIHASLIRDFEKDSEGNYWFATDKGVFRKTGKFIVRYTTANGLPHNYIYDIVADQKNTIWIATQGGLAYIKGNSVHTFSNDEKAKWLYSDSLTRKLLSSQSIRTIVLDHDNSLWVGSWSAGLFHIGQDSVYRFTQKEGLSDINIRGIQIDDQNNIWISTRYGGAFRFDRKTFKNYSVKDGLKSNWVFSVQTDNQLNIWFSTANGLTRYSGGGVITYDASEGINSAEIVSSIKSGGRMWFLSNSQIFSREIDKMENINNHPSIILKQVKLLDGNLPQYHPESDTNGNIRSILSQYTRNSDDSGETTLPYDQNSLVFDFSGIDFKDEHSVRYEYKLEGFDSKWTSSSNKNVLTYLNLPPGSYSFWVFAVNKAGTKSLSPAVFNFRILTPFWQRWWFVSLVIIAFVLIISAINYVIYQYRIRQAVKIEKLRSKISTDLHDEIGTSLSSIAIFSELIKRDKTIEPEKSHDMLERIENTSRELIEKMNDIVWAVNPGNDKFGDSLLKLKDYTVKILESRGVDVTFNVDSDGENTIIPMDVRRNMLLIFKELVTNSAKYSKADSVIITMKFENRTSKKIYLAIEDDGIGFDVRKASTGNGLKNILKRAAEIKAVYEIKSVPGGGTKAVLEIPLE